MPVVAKPVARAIAAYYDSLRAYAAQGAAHEGNTRQAFQTLLSDIAKQHGLTLLTEQTIKLPNRRTIRLDGEVRDQYTIQRGVWEAKDSADDLDSEIRKKIAAGYPLKNTIFENTRRAVLYQNNNRALDLDITQAANLQRVLHEFFAYSEPQIDQFHQAIAEFKRQIPDLARSLTEIIDGEKQGNHRFVQALDDFLRLCRASLNPHTSLDDVEDMLKQHLLTERIFRSVFDNPDFVQRNAIARELEKVVRALTSRSFSRDQFLRKLDYFYRAIEDTARTIAEYDEKQSFLNAVYEQFFQGYSTDTADTHGIVYTPAPLVKWMVRSVEEALAREWGLSLSDQGVHVLDPCVGTGTFMLELINTISSSALPHKYAHELHCNEVLLLPYYIAAQNIEHEYYERTGEYLPFEGICFADTLDMGATQLEMFAPENTERVKRQEETPIFVIIGNPPYNAGQRNENDNNKNRKHPQIDKRIADTYAKASRSSLKRKYYDTYVQFFRWATDRLRDNDGLICFVSNNSFVDLLDGVRQEFSKEFTSIYVLNLGGNVNKNPKLSGTTHNVFGIKLGIAITILIRRRGGARQVEPAKIYYESLNEWWRKEQKYSFLEATNDYTNVEWQNVEPDNHGTWITGSAASDFTNFVPLGSKEAKAGKIGAQNTIFNQYSLGVSTNRDIWVYAFDKQQLRTLIDRLINFYEEHRIRWQQRKDRSTSIDKFVQYDDRRIKWSDHLKKKLERGREIESDQAKIRLALYRPFTQCFLYYDRHLIDRSGMFDIVFPRSQDILENIVICLTDISAEKPFMALMTNITPDMHVVGAGANAQCFPFYTYDEDGTNRRENITDWALHEFRVRYGADVTKWDIFHGIYGLLHSPEYRARYAHNLKRDLPRIPFVAAEAWQQWVQAGRALSKLHVEYEQAAPFKLQHIENRAVPWTWRVQKMRLSADKTQLIVNEALTLSGIPAEAWAYRLGNRSALEWVIDQYQVKTDARSGIVSDPNRADDPQYIVRLVKQVITVSVETVNIVQQLPPLGSAEQAG